MKMDLLEVLTEDEEVDSHDGDAAGHKVADPAPFLPTGATYPSNTRKILWEKPD
jgi:hypothetical protein